MRLVGESPSWLRHRILIPAFEGSNPSSPATLHKLLNKPYPLGAVQQLFVFLRERHFQSWPLKVS